MLGRLLVEKESTMSLEETRVRASNLLCKVRQTRQTDKHGRDGGTRLQQEVITGVVRVCLEYASGDHKDSYLDAVCVI